MDAEQKYFSIHIIFSALQWAIIPPILFYLFFEISKGPNDERNNIVIPSINNTSKQVEDILTQLDLDHESIYDRQACMEMAKEGFQRIAKNASRPWPTRVKAQSPPEHLEKIEPEVEDLLNRAYDTMRCQFDINNTEHVTAWKELAAASKNKKNFFGRFLLSYSPDFDAFHRRSVELGTRNNSTRTLVALKIFHNTYGRYPAELNQLVHKKIINAIPLDLFANHPLLYDSSDQKIWSVGSDEENNEDDQKKILFLVVHF